MMGFLAKRRTKSRMERREFGCAMEFAEVERHFRETAEAAKPLKGVLSKGLRPFFNTILDEGATAPKPVVSYGRPSVGRQSGKMGVWQADWRVVLLPTDEGFATLIYQAQTWNGEIGRYEAYVRFHDEFTEQVRAADPTLTALDIRLNSATPDAAGLTKWPRH